MEPEIFYEDLLTSAKILLVYGISTRFPGTLEDIREFLDLNYNHFCLSL